jgi:AraC-like DNA-binding protein
MQPIVPPVYLLHDDPLLRDLLDQAPGRAYYLVPVPGWSALEDHLKRSTPMSIAVVDPRAGLEERDMPSEALRQLLASFPSATVVAALPVTGEDSALVQKLGECGVADVLDLVRERTPESVARRLRVVQGRTVHRVLQRALPEALPGRTRALLGVAAETVARGGLGPELAEALGVSERTVARWYKRADLPPPRRVLVWLRLLLAAELMDDVGRSFEAVARGCGYAGAGSLKGAVRLVLQTSLRELRLAGAFRTSARAFREELWGFREEALRRPRPEKIWLN